MEPFTIKCDTCNSRIRVRNPALLGQLVNCPKCNSMVLVTPPDSLPPESATESATATGATSSGRGLRAPQIEVERHDRPTVDSAALTQEGLPAELIEATSPHSLTSPPGGEAGDEYRLAPELPDAEAAESGFAASSPAPPPIQAAGQFAAPDSRPHLPSADWTSDSTTKARQMLLVGFLGFAGVLLAALMFIGFLRWYATEEAKSVANSATASTVSAEASSPEASAVSPEGVSAEEAGLPAQPDDSPNAAPLDDTATTPELADTDQADASPAADERSVDSTLPAADDSIGKPVTEGLPEPAAENAANGAEELADEPDAGQPAVALPKQLQAFGPMLQYEIQPQFSDAMEILSEAPVTAEDLGLTTSTETAEMPSVDLQAQLQVTIPALVIGELPLSQFVSLWSNLSGIPTTVDLDSLTAAGIDRNQSVGLAMVKSVTLGSLAGQLGAPLGLQTVPRDNRFLELVAPGAAMEEHLPQDVSLAGLVDADQEAWLLEALPRLLPEFAVDLTPADNSEHTDNPEASDDIESPDMPEAPEDSSEDLDSLVDSGESDASEDSVAAAADEFPVASSVEAVVWRIEQGRLLRPQTASGGVVDPRVWSTAVRLLEGWRHAAGLPAASADFDPALHSARLVAPSEVVGLDFELQQVQAEARPVAQVLPSICQAAGLQAWMDWPALSSLGLGPSSTALVLTNARPLRRALADYASKFSLVVAVLDSQSLWITSNQAYRTSPRLYVVPSQGESVEVWSTRLRPLTPAASSGFGVGQVVVISTPDSKFMLVRCCPMQVEFQ